jgi:protein TonB
MLHPFISSPYAGGHYTPVLALSASVHAVLFYAAVTSSGVEHRTRVQPLVAAAELVRFAELPVRRAVTHATPPDRRDGRPSAASAEPEFKLPALARSLDILLPDPPPLPDYQPEVATTDFSERSGIGDDVLHLGLNAGGSRIPPGARFAAYEEASVERRATPVRENQSPRYPYWMLRRRVETRFAIIFVVDSTGTVDRETVEWPPAVEREFTQAVEDVLSHWRFVPAQIGGRRVRQRVLQPFLFRVDGRIGY